MGFIPTENDLEIGVIAAYQNHVSDHPILFFVGHWYDGITL